jgi:hypothetical protein
MPARLGTRRLLSLVAIGVIAVATLAVSARAGHDVETVIDIALPQYAASTACSTSAGSANLVIAGAHGHTLRVSCPAPLVSLRCSGAGVEPLEMPLTEVCRTRRLPLQAARDARILVGQRVQLGIEWLSLTAADQHVIATRPVVAEGELSLPVAATGDRFLRFSRAGASPVTVPTALLLASRSWRLPDPQLGGELVALITSATVLPVTYHITGGRSEDIGRHDRDVIAVSGLPAGAYEVIPEYEGGLKGATVPVNIQAATSTVVALKSEPVGTASISAASTACTSATEFGLQYVARTAWGTVRTDAFRTSALSACRWTVSGLKPGRYDAWLRGASGSAGSQGFDVEPQRQVAVTLAPPTVNVSGHVTYGDAPIGNLSITFMRDSDGFAVRTTTDNSGTYSLSLDGAGPYRVVLHDDMLSESRHASLTQGENSVDFAIKRGATLHVRVLNPQSDGAATIDIRSEASSGFLSQKTLATGTNEVSWSALDFGSYDVSARQGALAAAIKTITLDPDHAEGFVDLELDENRSTLRLHDEAGQAVTDARFYFLIPPPPQLSPGVYALQGVAPGTQLRIRASASLVPACRVAPHDQSIDVALARGRPITLQLPAHVAGLGTYRGSLILDGSDCPIPLTDFASVPLPVAPTEPSRFLIQNFPPTNTLTLVGPHGPQTLIVPDTGVVTLKP